MFSIRDSLMIYINLVEKSQVSLGIFSEGTVFLGLIMDLYSVSSVTKGIKHFLIFIHLSVLVAQSCPPL